MGHVHVQVRRGPCSWMLGWLTAVSTYLITHLPTGCCGWVPLLPHAPQFPHAAPMNTSHAQRLHATPTQVTGYRATTSRVSHRHNLLHLGEPATCPQRRANHTAWRLCAPRICPHRLVVRSSTPLADAHLNVHNGAGSEPGQLSAMVDSGHGEGGTWPAPGQHASTCVTAWMHASLAQV